jgi:sulfur-carrier protein
MALSVTVSLSGALASVAGVTTIQLEAESLSEVLAGLSSRYGGAFSEKLYDANGKPRRFINIYVNGRDYRFLKKLDTELANKDEVSLIPAVSGG